ncbi:hypothetical protein ACWEO4_21570 [Streptomyces sp. NPDC004393]
MVPHPLAVCTRRPPQHPLHVLRHHGVATLAHELPASVRAFDAGREQLADALLQARHAVTAAETVLSVTRGESRTLGELMRDPIWSDVERQRIVDNFIRAGIS